MSALPTRVLIGPQTLPQFVNHRNLAFWTEIGKRFDEESVIPGTMEEALQLIARQTRKNCNLGSLGQLRQQDSLYTAVDEVLAARRRYAKEFSLKGRSARPVDPLTATIMSILRRRPQISSAELVEALRRSVPNEAIIEVTEEDIMLAGGRAVPLSGLKFRLFRAKKMLEKGKKIGRCATG